MLKLLAKKKEETKEMWASMELLEEQSQPAIKFK